MNLSIFSKIHIP